MTTPHLQWFKIHKEVCRSRYAKAVKPLYNVLEERHVSKGKDDVFLKSVLSNYYDLSESEWKTRELERMKQKALEMKMGDFHEEIIGSLHGFETLKNGHESGCDARKRDGSLYIEIKNRDNTIKGEDGKHVVHKLQKILDNGKEAILVYINSEKKTLPRFGAPKNSKIQFMEGRKAYAKFSGRESFFDDLNETLAYTLRNFKKFEELEKALGTS
jgi:hypothetical protein